jgi:tetratricopeptide (TPR) repeat protein
MPHLTFALVAVLGVAGLTVELGQPAPDDIAATRAGAFRLAYNLDHREAVDLLGRGLAAHPDDPSLHRGLAAVSWLAILFLRGAVTVDYFSGGLTSRVELERPPPDLDARFRSAVDRAISLSEARTRRRPDDADAHYELGAAVGLRMTYVATVEGSVLSAIRQARRAFDEHERVLALDPRRKDAGLIVGSYRYAVGSLSPPMRLMAYLVGFGGGRERGLRMIEEASRYPSDAQPEAEFVLLLIYNRERRYADALAVVEKLEARYPRNRLLLLEEGSTALRAGDAARASRVLNRGIEWLGRETRPLAFGERALWFLKRGTALLRLARIESAAEDLRAAERAAQSEAAPWVRGRIALESGKLADVGGDRRGAISRYRDARRLCAAGHDESCVEEANALSQTAYKGTR